MKFARAFMPIAIAAALAGSFVTSSVLATDTPSVPTTIAVPKVYVIPMEGQMGTDIDKSIYEDIVKDVAKAKPDIIVYRLKSADFDDNYYMNTDDKREAGISKLTDYRDMVKYLRTELRSYPQIMWVNDAVGWSALLALAWPDMYMSSKARLFGLVKVSQTALGWDDPDVAAKMMAAWTGIGKGFLEMGGYPLEIGDALMFPKKTLSARWEGRKVKWTLDNEGTWIVDDNPERTPLLNAQIADDSGISDGTADSVDDLLFMLGFREFTKIDSGEKLFKSYVDDWRRDFAKCEDLLRQVTDPTGTSGDAEKAIGKAKRAAEDILAMMKRYPAIETRLQRERGVSRLALENGIAAAKEQLRRIKEAERAKGRGPGGGGNAPGGSGLGGGKSK
ncbi:MAG: hypothetical protein SGJ09_01670 [Phycisphaerae bacterium]|nr:hypothetical protein [Phycisphaerae bacterium]